LHLSIVDYDCKLIGWDIIPSPNHEITEVGARYESLWPHMQVLKADRLFVGDSETPVHALGLGELASVGACSTVAGIERLIVNVIRRTCRQSEVFARTDTGINPAAVSQATPSR
jgi:hypothetical protein